MSCGGCDSDGCGPGPDSDMEQTVQYVTTFVEMVDDSSEVVPAPPDENFGFKMSALGNPEYNDMDVMGMSNWDLLGVSVGDGKIFYTWRRAVVVRDRNKIDLSI